jgi:hypothetical protein
MPLSSKNSRHFGALGKSAKHITSNLAAQPVLGLLAYGAQIGKIKVVSLDGLEIELMAE